MHRALTLLGLLPWIHPSQVASSTAIHTSGMGKENKTGGAQPEEETTVETQPSPEAQTSCR